MGILMHHMVGLLRRHARSALIAAGIAALAGGCDLLDQGTVVGENLSERGKPANLATPDSVVKMLEWIFDRHTREAVDEMQGLLWAGYVYQGVPTADANPLQLYRDQEIASYGEIFARFENVEGEFYIEPERSPTSLPEEFRTVVPAGEEGVWRFLSVLGDMTFTNTNNAGIQEGLRVYQRFLLAFRPVNPASPMSTWQLAAWIDKETLFGARIARPKAE